MEYKHLFVLAALLILVAGCGSKEPGSTVVTSQPTQGSGSQETTTEQPAAPTNIVLTMSEAEKSLAEEKLKKGQKVAVSTPMKIMAVGDVYTFAVGIKNTYPNPKNFRLKPVLDDAKSTGLSNLISTDETIENWLARTNFSPFELGGAEQKIVPFIVEVGPEVAVGAATGPGSYTFDVEFEIESTPGFWDKYNTGEDLLVIKVK